MNKLFALILLLILAVLYGAWVFGTSAQAHSWYPASCCSGTAVGGDCMPLPDGAVSQTAKGYRVDFTDPVWGAVHEDVMSRDVQPSRDGQFHACLKPPGYPIRIRCFFAPLSS